MDPLTMLGLGSSLVGGLSDLLGGSSSSKKAAKGYKQANATLRDNDAYITGLLGNAANYGEGLEMLRNLSGMRGGQAAQNAMGAFQTAPGYTFRRDQGEGAINRGAAARGNWASGRTLADLAGYNSNLASDEYGRWYGNLYNLTGMGLDAAQGLAGMKTGIARQIGQNQINKGLARAGSSPAAAIGQGLQGGLGALAYGMGQSSYAPINYIY